MGMAVFKEACRSGSKNVSFFPGDISDSPDLISADDRNAKVKLGLDEGRPRKRQNADDRTQASRLGQPRFWTGSVLAGSVLTGPKPSSARSFVWIYHLRA